MKRNDYVVVEWFEQVGKIKADIVRILTKDHIKLFKREGVWPFDDASLINENSVNTNGRL